MIGDDLPGHVLKAIARARVTIGPDGLPKVSLARGGAFEWAGEVEARGQLRQRLDLLDGREARHAAQLLADLVADELMAPTAADDEL